MPELVFKNLDKGSLIRVRLDGIVARGVLRELYRAKDNGITQNYWADAINRKPSLVCILCHPNGTIGLDPLSLIDEAAYSLLSPSKIRKIVKAASNWI